MNFELTEDQGAFRDTARAFAEDRSGKFFRHDNSAHHGVGDLGVDRNAHVAQQRPRGRCPHGKVRRTGKVVIVRDVEGDVARLVNLVGIRSGLTEFMARE